MFDHTKQLISTLLTTTASRAAADATNEAVWDEATLALAPTRDQEPEIARILAARDTVALGRLLEAWRLGTQHLPAQDREVLKRALKAFRKTLKVTRLAADSGLGHGATSSGRTSNIVGMRPPDRYPYAVWAELVRQKRLRDGGRGMYELPHGER
jgi:hypothetical protein